MIQIVAWNKKEKGNIKQKLKKYKRQDKKYNMPNQNSDGETRECKQQCVKDNG